VTTQQRIYCRSDHYNYARYGMPSVDKTKPATPLAGGVQ
jgi:hypothetical protein